jgi:predicted dienelactone hydrolase
LLFTRRFFHRELIAMHDVLTLQDDERRSWTSDEPRPIRTYVWRPDGALRGTVLVSHGTGGSAEEMAWLTGPLANAGFLAVAVDHHGNNSVDGYEPEGFARWWERPQDLSVVLDQLGADEELGPLGAAGFSLGGYTAAALVGARVDADLYAALFAGTIPAVPPPEYPSLVEDLRARLSEDDVVDWVADSGRDYSDERVQAGFLVCPAIGRMLDERSLAAIDRPIAIRFAGADDIAPPEDNADVYAEAIPRAELRSVGADVGHYAFIGSNPEGADVRERVAGEAVDFFEANLRPTS